MLGVSPRKDEETEEREYIERTKRLRSMYVDKIKALDAILYRIDRKVRKPLSGVSPVKAAIEYLSLAENKGKRLDYYSVVKYLLAEGCCDDTEFPSRSVSQGLSKGIRDGSLAADREGEKYKNIWLP